MASQITNYQCPACTGPLHYGEKSGKLECDYCGSVYTIKEIEALYSDKNQSAAAAAQTAQAVQEAEDIQSIEYSEAAESGWGDDGKRMRAYNCPSCGAEIMCDDTTAASSCPYCGNPHIVPAKFEGTLKPKYVIPFKVTKEDAENALRNFYKGKKFLPTAFASENHIEEIKGVYVPFWLYDGNVAADVTFTATRVFTETRGDERITTTDHYHVRRAGHMQFFGIPADGSSKMPDAYMDAVEPFNYNELKPFSMAYLPGFLADRYDVSAQECSKRAFSRAENTAVNVMHSDPKGYATLIPVNTKSGVSKATHSYALLPVWMLSTSWQGTNYLFAMNGQTGKMIGNLPISKAKVAAWFSGITVGLSAIASVIYMMVR